MSSTFNPQILMHKLAKLNTTKESIETLSHWCIFHMNQAKDVVEMWDRQFRICPPVQRLAFLYLANDVLKNSRQKGSEFVGEFWKVLPEALRYMIENGDRDGRKAVLRLISIWDERKVFGSKGQLLVEEFVGGNKNNKIGNPRAIKLRESSGNALEKIVSGFHALYGGQLDEDTTCSKCRTAMDRMEKIFSERKPVQLEGSGVMEEINAQNAIVKGCIAQLSAIEASRATLIAHLREALEEQEFKLDEVRNQIQTAQSRSLLATTLCKPGYGPVSALVIPGPHVLSSVTSDGVIMNIRSGESSSYDHDPRQKRLKIEDTDTS